MNNWSDYELLFDILVILTNVLWYLAIIAVIIDWVRKAVAEMKHYKPKDRKAIRLKRKLKRKGEHK